MKVLSAVGLALVLVLLPVPAMASTPERVGREVCTVGSLAVPLGEEIPEEVPLVMSCFDTFAEAESFIEAGAPGDLEQLIGVPSMARGLVATAASTVTIGRAWTGTGKGGSELVHWGTGSGCYGVTYGFPTLPAGWNDNIRSAQGFSNCWVTHYENASFGGNPLNCVPYCSTLGFLNGKSSSIVYRPTGTFG